MYVHYLLSNKHQIRKVDTASVISTKDGFVVFGVPHRIKDSDHAIYAVCTAEDLLYFTDSITKEEETEVVDG